MKTVLVTGGSGYIGSALCDLLNSKGYEVRILTRSKNAELPYPSFYWNYKKREIDPAAVNGCNVIIHLAGAGIADKRWTNARKKELIDSRVESAQFLTEVINKTGAIDTFISASGIGFYGMINSDEVFTEESPVHKDFLGNLCLEWESASAQGLNEAVRAVQIRTGIVVSNSGGAMDKMKLPIQFGVGAALGSGKQFMPWISLQDLCRVYLNAITNKSYMGPVNAVTPNYISNSDFTKVIAKSMNRMVFLPPVPEFVLKIILGKMSKMLVTGVKIKPKKLQDLGFNFEVKKLENALQ